MVHNKHNKRITGSQALAIIGRLTIAAAGIMFKIILLFGHRYYYGSRCRGGLLIPSLYVPILLLYIYIRKYPYYIIIYLFSDGVSIENRLRGKVYAIK